ncbi:hypothetical protein SAMN05421741_11953 [Paenimyroides ummariense]|uniref:Uncharacterized protein n=1 Tax=Paenimyroides ummariense TaxID=913024 RepID=A0A1I5E9X2_9FLAO|nr:hypothetical protein [Paenimyroides ummariense]SFO08324.1 hypothetical protein SAMN05421741_11953 [Paenimyroides ummariense]
MNTNLKNAIVGIGFLSCAMVLTAIVSLGTINSNQDADLLAKAKITKSVTATSTEIQNIK